MENSTPGVKCTNIRNKVDIRIFKKKISIIKFHNKIVFFFIFIITIKYEPLSKYFFQFFFLFWTTVVWYGLILILKKLKPNSFYLF